MASIVKRKVKNSYYYYLVESARVNGKPRIVKQKYLGSASDIENAVNLKNTEIPEPEYSVVFEFGAVYALFDIAERNGVREIINKHAGKRAQGMSIGDYMLLAAINRAVSPTSKHTFVQWFDKTVLSRQFSGANSRSLSSQGFWNNMSTLDQAKIRAIEDDLTKALVKNYDLRTDCLIFDNTNFFTYMDTANQASLPRRGKSKEKRSDLKIIGMSLMVSPEHNIPLFHEAYEGNMNDAKRFGEVAGTLKERYGKLGCGECDPTLIFDKGNNSEPNILALLSENPRKFHFVGSLRLNQCPEMMSAPAAKFSLLTGECFRKASAYRSKKDIYGKEMTVVVTYNPELFNAQLGGISANIAKCSKELCELKERLALRASGVVTKGKKPTVESVKKNVNAILSPEHMKTIFVFNVLEAESGTIDLKYSLDEEKFEKLKSEVLGKSILFTDRHDWETERIVSAYRAQYHVEACFRQMKDTKYLSFRPVHHFTDTTIRVHAFYCVLALTLCSILNKELAQMGHTMSIHAMLDMFQEVQLVVTIFLLSARKKTRRLSFSRLSGPAKDYIDEYGLLKYSSMQGVV
jgi:transposase